MFPPHASPLARHRRRRRFRRRQDFARHTGAAALVRIEPRPVVIVEGTLLFTNRRLRERGPTIENVIEQYLRTVRPMHLEFVKPSKRWTDIIIPEGGSNAIGVEMLRAGVALEVRRSRGT